MHGVFWKKVDHRFTRIHASEYLDGELSRAQHERVERHSSVCPSCRALLASLQRMIQTLPGLAARPQRGVTDGVLERLRLEG